jgi:hypothetical protein
MANVKITDLPSLTGANSASTDLVPVVDVSADITSKMTRAEFFSNVSISSGTITGITDLAIADGGTGASTAAGAIANFGITATAAQINPLTLAFDNAFFGAGSTGNLANGANDFGNNARWLNTQTANGVTLTRVGFGVDTDGRPYVDYSVVGTPTTGSHTMDVYVQAQSVTAATLGQVFTTSCLAQIIGGTVPTDANTGIRVEMRGQTSLAVQTEAFFTDVTRPTVQTLRTLTSTLAAATTAQIICGVVLRVQSGVTANFTVRIKGLQFDRGSSRLAYVFKARTPTEARADLGLGTIATQSAASVAITGGTINATSVGATTPSTGAFTTVTATGTISDVAGNLRDIVNNAKTSAYVLALTDNGEMINITTGGVTINSGIFSAGNNVTIYNNSASSQTITQGAGVTLRLAGSSTTGNRTLALRGICTIVCVASNEFVVSGAGLS